MDRGWEEKGKKERDPDFIFVDELGTGPTRTKYILPFSSSLSISCFTLPSPPLLYCTFSFSFLSGYRLYATRKLWIANESRAKYLILISNLQDYYYALLFIMARIQKKFSDS